MALTTTQVNAAFVALLGRAAEGNANAWAVNSADTTTLANTILSVDGSFKNDLEQAKTNEDFVAALYEKVLGREADADGKAFWLKALANGTSRDELKANFLAAAKANNEDLSAFNTSNQDFLSKVYSTLLNREVDSSGLEYWTNLLNNGTSKAEVVASIIDAINANQTSEDYAIYNAKMSVANAVTAAFAGPKAGLNEEQSEELNKQLVSIMSSVTGPDVTEESIKSQIDNVVGLYGKEAAPLAFKAVTDKMEEYELGNADSTSAQTFRGTINLQDPAKSTISNKAKLNTSNFSDTLVVDVISSIDNKEFNYTENAKQVQTFAEQEGIKNLTINNGTAAITNLDSKGISENLKITGAANVSGSVTTKLGYLEVNTGGSADATATITVKAELKEYVGKGSGKDILTVSGDGATTVKVGKINTGAGDDKLTVSGSGSVTTVDLGSGKDTLTVSGAGASISGAKINLGAGDDKITLATVAEHGLKGATIDGGAGRDTLIVSGDISDKGDFTLKNIEVLQASGASAKVSYAQIKDQALTLTSGAGGNLEIKADKETTIDLTKLNKNVASGETALDTLKLINVGSGATVTLNKDDGIAETIKLDADAKGENKVTINGIASGDKLDLSAIDGLSSVSNYATSSFSGGNKIADTKLYFVDAGKVIDTAEEALKALTSAGASAFTASSAKALIAFNNGGKSYLFAAKGNGDSDTNTIVASELTLIAIVDNKIDANDTAAEAGILTFA